MAATLLYRQVPSKGISTPEGFEQKGVKKEDYLFVGMLVLFIAAGLVISHLFDPLLPSLFLRLSKIGALAFGGGYTAIPLIQYEVVDRFEWLTTKQFLDGIAMGQVTPGPILITATFIGFKLSGLLGALVATVGIFSSSFFILVLFIPYYDWLRKREVVKVVERGILGSFMWMLGLVLFNFGRTAFVDAPSVILATATFFALLKKIPLPYILLSGGILSILIFGLLY
jgi:chromate transporter